MIIKSEKMKPKTIMTFTLFIILFLTIFSTGCIDDDSDKIEGTWMHEVVEEDQRVPDKIYVTFESDGTGYFQRWADEVMEFRWEIIEVGTILVGDDDGSDISGYRFENDDILILFDPDDPEEKIEYTRVDPDDLKLPRESEWLVGGLEYIEGDSNITAYQVGSEWRADVRIRVSLDQPAAVDTEDVTIIVRDDRGRQLLDHRFTMEYSLLDDGGQVVTGTSIQLTVHDLVEDETISDHEVSLRLTGYENKISTVIN